MLHVALILQLKEMMLLIKSLKYVVHLAFTLHIEISTTEFFQEIENQA